MGSFISSSRMMTFRRTNLMRNEGQFLFRRLFERQQTTFSFFPKKPVVQPVSPVFLQKYMANSQTPFQAFLKAQQRMAQTTPYQYERNYVEKNTIGKDEGAIWISGVYRLGRLKNLQRLAARLTGQENKFDAKIHDEIEGGFNSLEFPSIRQIIPSLKDNGCYLTFASKEQARQVYTAMKDSGIQIAGHVRPVFLVKGKPFIEDITTNNPSPKIKIDLASPDKCSQRLSSEMIFKETRRYGPVEKVLINDKKDSVSVLFSWTNSAISARNCLHQMVVGDSKLLIAYEKYSRWHWITDFLSNAKIMIPLIGIGSTLSIYLLVEPTRIGSVTQKIARGFYDADFFEVVKNQGGFVPPDRMSMRNDLLKLFKTAPESAIIISGSSGSGKSMLAKNICSSRTFTSYIDCSQFTSPEALIEHFGRDIGFSPSFSALNTLLGTVESLLPGFKKSALSPTIQFQIESMLTTLERTLMIISTSSPVICFDSFNTLLSMLASDKPDERDKAKLMLGLLFDWANRNVSRAHIVFVVENYLGEEFIKQHPAIRREQCITYRIEDLPKDQAASYLKQYLKVEMQPEDLDYALDCIGGRISDLEGLVQRCNSGLTVRQAIGDVIRGADFEIRSRFGTKIYANTSDFKWTQVQLWKTIKTLTQTPISSYDDVLVNCFGGDHQALTALIRAHLLTVFIHNNEKVVSAVSPLFQLAFKKLVQNPLLNIKLNILEKKYEIERIKSSITEIETELVQLWKAEKSTTSSLQLKGIAERRSILDSRLFFLSQKITKKEQELTQLESQ